MGSVLTPSPGQEETFRLPQLGVEETESFTIVVKAEDQEGNDYEFTSEPFEIVVGLEGLDDEEDAGSRGRVAVLRTILIVIILLIILTAGALLYVLRDSIPFFQKFRKRRTLKNKAPSSRELVLIFFNELLSRNPELHGLTGSTGFGRFFSCRR